MPDLFTNPADGLLYNNVRAPSEGQLDRIEADLSVKRLMFVRAQVGLTEPRQAVEPIIGPAYTIPPTPLRFSEQHFRAMHRYLFHDVYPWAGETRQDRDFQSYRIKIECTPGRPPKVFVLNPSNEYRDHSLPHFYPATNSLCLYYPSDLQWSDRHHLHDKTIPWLAEWLLFYELYQITGRWEGPTVHRGAGLN